MPSYDFKCPKCGFIKTEVLKIDERNNLFMCEKCNTSMKRTVGAPNFELKGVGWYKDGYKNKILTK